MKPRSNKSPGKVRILLCMEEQLIFVSKHMTTHICFYCRSLSDKKIIIIHMYISRTFPL